MSRLILERTGNLEFRLVFDAVLFGVKVPEGFRTNGASVPQPFWSILSPFTHAFEPANVHDFRYCFPGEIPRRQADREFLRNMKTHGVFWLTRWIVFLAARVFGGFFFDSVRNRTFRQGRHWSKEQCEQADREGEQTQERMRTFYENGG